jgi:hypothetical protein
MLEKKRPLRPFFLWYTTYRRYAVEASLDDPAGPLVPYSGIVCRAARAGTWRFAAQFSITCIVQPFPGTFQRHACTYL